MNRTNTLFTKWLALFALLGLLPSCVLQDARDVSTDKVYFTFNIGSALSHQGGLRAHDSDAPQINQDDLDFEDRVERLAVFVFDSSTSALAGSVFTSATSFKLKIDKPGTYDFYFIANYIDQPVGSPDRVEEFDTRTKVEAYLVKEQLKGDTFFSGIKGSGAAMPMARVYKSQDVGEGGTYMAPKPFHPTVGDVNEHQLKPISSYGNDYQPNKTQKTVNLVRACAKLSFTLSGNGVQDIESVKYHNVAADYTFMETPERDKKGGEPDVYTAGTEQKLELPAYDPAKPNGPIMVSAYVPERLFVNTNPSWTDHTTNGINFITITMKSGKEYEIPVITNDNISDSYMDFAIGTGANYSVIRNHHYMYNIKVPEDNKQLDVQFKVMPWTLVESEMSYARPEYDLQILGADGRDYKQILDEVIMNDVNYQPTSVTIKFKITAPKGAIWTATITNGRDFILDGEVKGLINEGIVTGVEEWHTMTLTPRYPFEKEPRYTQFYITVEGKEIYLGFDSSGNIINRFIGDGSAEKWRFKQERTILQGLGN
ncbi:hypothetical protein IX332_001320 [Porphyromonas levii]|uniref:FimB/Mfa2 family fimbrial subunit n=1 Tax=Porphyromonas levii TaxID=28114 RepID=UPI001B8B94EF|nr:FimB/Mfa2 family fimbrial subunit [Porphyromonas levii]MBR8729991.1 hypothetical protein [Porphyromonas levii]